MNIQLKNIKIADHLSAETTAFSADLFIEGKKVGTCGNHGTGGATIYHPLEIEYRQAIGGAEKYCADLPKIPIKLNGALYMIPSTLENVIDSLIYEFQNNTALQKFYRQMEQDMKRSILIGTDERYTAYNMNRPLEQFIHCGTNPIKAINDFLRQIRRRMKPGERVLNTNLPAGVIIPEVQL